MTMQHQIHPDDERLAALSGGDPEVASDAALRAHVESCDRCTDVVRELGSLRTALSELPDLVPSRPLQLLPPVAEPRVASRGGWLRRLAGPAMAAGFVLVAVGAIGSSGFSLGMGSAGAAPSQAEAAGQDSMTGGSPLVAPGAAASPETSTRGMNLGSEGQRSEDQESNTSPQTQPVAPPADRGGTDSPFAPADPRLPWLVVLGLGVGLLMAGIYLRFAQQPRAG
jgi:hypothetical protein